MKLQNKFWEKGTRDLPTQIQLIGQGEVGGKAGGIIFTKRRMEESPLTPYDHLILFPDSTVLTTEVYDQFIRDNRLTDTVYSKCSGNITFEEMAERFILSDFPFWTAQKLKDFLKEETRPLVVRSSALMEDSPDHSYAGVYLSEFLANKGSLEKRLQELISSIKRIYISTFGERAKAYRKKHGLPWEDEKMAVLIQNMIGSLYPGNMYYPLVGGVAYSRNFYPWTNRLSEEDGVARLAVGVGTQAVSREYARVFSPKLPALRPEGSNPDEIIRYAQERVDVLDMSSETFHEVRLSSLENPHFPKVVAVVNDDNTLSEYSFISKNHKRLIATFDRLIKNERFSHLTPILKNLLDKLEDLFNTNIDMEFALDFVKKSKLSEIMNSKKREAIERDFPNRDEIDLFYLLQMRRLRSHEEFRPIHLPHPSPDRILLSSHNVLGNGYKEDLKHVIFVDPEKYHHTKGHGIARKVGKLDRWIDEKYILIGPGRWGTSNAQLGVPVRYGEISGASVVVEMATGRFSPELSYGTHFYADMVTSNTIYLPCRLDEGDLFNHELLQAKSKRGGDEYVSYFKFEEGLDVYADGNEKEGLIVLRDRT